MCGKSSRIWQALSVVGGSGRYHALYHDSKKSDQILCPASSISLLINGVVSPCVASALSVCLKSGRSAARRTSRTDG